MEYVVLVLRNIAFWLDQIVFSFISTVYNLLYEITNTNIFSNEIFEQFSTKIYALIGIFMLFKVSVSIFSYIVDPDAFLDKSKGFNKIISNVVISFALLIFVPLIFKMGLDLQNIVLKSNFIGRLFMLDDFSSTNVLNPGDSMAYESLTAFYHFDTLTYPLCEGNSNEWNENCKNSLIGNGITESEYDNLKKFLGYGYELKNVNLYMNSNTMHITDDNDNYVMYYLPIISTFAGGAIVLLLIVFCFDVAVRNVKMGFLQMIAPVPIISRIDPKTGKGVFDKWVKATISTYLDLFMRLLAINFAIFVISLVSMEFTNGNSDASNSSLMAKVFIILGILLFAKELPKLIKDITGFDTKGTFTMNPLNKLRQVPIVGAATTTAMAMAGGAYTGYKAGKQAGHIGRGIIQGMAAAHGDIKGKIPWSGADGKTKSPRAWHSGSNAGYKAITGKEFSQRSFLKDFYAEKGFEEIEGLKADRSVIQGKQAELNAELQSLYNQLQHYTEGSEEYNAIQQKIRDNRAANGKYDKNIRSIEDQISDIKRLYTIDESPKKDVDSAKAAAANIRKINNNLNNRTTATSSTSSTSAASATSENDNFSQSNIEYTNATLKDKKYKINDQDVILSPGQSVTNSGIILPSSSVDIRKDKKYNIHEKDIPVSPGESTTKSGIDLPSSSIDIRKDKKGE